MAGELWQRYMGLRVVRRLAQDLAALTGVGIDLCDEKEGQRYSLPAGLPPDLPECGCSAVSQPGAVAKGKTERIPLLVDCRPGRHHYLVPLGLGESDGYLLTAPFRRDGNRTAPTSEPSVPYVSAEGERFLSHFLVAIADEMAQFQEASALAAPRQASDESSRLVGQDPAIRALKDQIRAVAQSGHTVLVEGESGTGKDVVAWLVHAAGQEAQGPFVVVNCAALPESLFESEVFGHARGAFTGAQGEKAGLVEAASGGTLFLDEIAELSLGAQAKLLGVLETKTYYRLGSVQPRRANVRVIAATNRELATLVAAGKFRLDLFYRLRVLTLRLPPLRERRSDIPLLAHHFLTEIARRSGQPVRKVTPEAEYLLTGYAWPGNVRQLLNELEGAYVRSGGQDLTAEHLSPEVRQGGALRYGARRSAAVASWEKDELERELVRAGWNVSALAKRLGISRRGLTKKLARLGLRRPRGP